MPKPHGKKGFLIPTMPLVKIEITNVATATKYLVLPTKRLVAAAKFLVEATKYPFVVPNFAAVTKPFFRASKFDYHNQTNFAATTKQIWLPQAQHRVE